MGNCQNYGPFLGPYYNTGPNTGPNLGDPKRDHNFDNPPCGVFQNLEALLCKTLTYWGWGLPFQYGSFADMFWKAPFGITLGMPTEGLNSW